MKLQGIHIILIIAVVVVTVCVILCVMRLENEKYGTVLGALGPYQELIAECMNQCNRTDPSRRLLSQGDWNCGAYCVSVYTEFARQGVPPETLKVNTSMSDCEKQCSRGEYATNPSAKRKCVSVCTGQNEVAKWCKELQCPYTIGDKNECMFDCVRTNTTNNNQVSWNWSEHG